MFALKGKKKQKLATLTKLNTQKRWKQWHDESNKSGLGGGSNTTAISSRMTHSLTKSYKDVICWDRSMSLLQAWVTHEPCLCILMRVWIFCIQQDVWINLCWETSAPPKPPSTNDESLLKDLREIQRGLGVKKYTASRTKRLIFYYRVCGVWRRSIKASSPMPSAVQTLKKYTNH